jgi:hypothetical protein
VDISGLEDALTDAWLVKQTVMTPMVKEGDVVTLARMAKANPLLGGVTDWPRDHLPEGRVYWLREHYQPALFHPSGEHTFCDRLSLPPGTWVKLERDLGSGEGLCRVDDDADLRCIIPYSKLSKSETPVTADAPGMMPPPLGPDAPRATVLASTFAANAGIGAPVKWFDGTPYYPTVAPPPLDEAW